MNNPTYTTPAQHRERAVECFQIARNYDSQLQFDKAWEYNERGVLHTQMAMMLEAEFNEERI